MPITLRILLGVYSQNSNPHNPSVFFNSGLQIDAVMPIGHPLRSAQHIARVYETEPENWTATIEERLKTLDYAIFINCDAKGGQELYSHTWPDKLLRFLPLDPNNPATKSYTKTEQKAWCEANGVPWSKKDQNQQSGTVLFLAHRKIIRAWYATSNGVILPTGEPVTCRAANDSKIFALTEQIASKIQVEGLAGFEYTASPTGKVAATKLHFINVPPIAQFGKYFSINLGEILACMAQRKKEFQEQEVTNTLIDQDLVLVPEIINYLSINGWKATNAIITNGRIIEIEGDRLLFIRLVTKALLKATKYWLTNIINKCINKVKTYKSEETATNNGRKRT